MSHTPGPWKVVDRLYVWTDDAVGCEVAKVCDENIDDDMLGQCDADARLIAAAPDLLDAVEELLIYLADWDDPDNETCQRARAAVAKAKGERL